MLISRFGLVADPRIHEVEDKTIDQSTLFVGIGGGVAGVVILALVIILAAILVQ